MPHYNQSTRQRIADLSIGMRVDRAANTSPLGNADLFTIVGGKVAVVLLLGEVTTNIENQPTTIRFTSDPTVGADAHLCGAAGDIDNQAAGIKIWITGTAATDAQMANAVAPMQADAVIVSPGKIKVAYGAASTGAIKYSLWYVPLEDGAYVEAA